MTIEKKRELLHDFCDDQPTCIGCPLYVEGFTCGRGFHFNSKNKVSDDEVNRAYDLVFTTVPNPINDPVNHPSHYNQEGQMQCIDEMVMFFGKEVVKCFCLCNAWKYRYRSNAKNGDEDLKKAAWYVNKYRELCQE